MELIVEPGSKDTKPIEKPNRTLNPSQGDTYGTLISCYEHWLSRLPYGYPTVLEKCPNMTNYLTVVNLRQLWNLIRLNRQD